MRARRQPDIAAVGAVELLDSAGHLLRRAGADALLAWSLGTVPFLIGLLLFVTEMTSSPFAEQRLLAASFLLALLYVWMKTWQHRFATLLTAILEDAEPPRLGIRGWLNAAAVQARLQSTGLLLLPAAALAILPFGWVYAFYQSLSVTGEARAARRQAARWPGQNHQLLAVLVVCAVVVFANIFAVVVMVPGLLQSFLGVETAMSRSPLSMLNTTTLAVALAGSYLVLGPLVKAAYVLRCFAGDAEASGADLLQQLSELVRLGQEPQP